MIKDIEKCDSCKMCDTIISLHERIKLLESAAVEIYGRILPQHTTAAAPLCKHNFLSDGSACTKCDRTWIDL
jgi:hypothetical protein